MSILDLMITSEWRGRPATFRKDRIIVSVLPSVPDASIEHTIESAMQAVSGSAILIRPPGRRWALVSVVVGTDINSVIAHVATQPDIEYAEPDFLIQGSAAPATDDPELSRQFWLDIVRAKPAWRLTKGKPRVLIAVLDSGVPVDATGTMMHPDLKTRRYIVHHAGVNHDYTETGLSYPTDGHGHGTRVTGVVGAMTNNRIGVAGMNWVSRVYIARVLDDDANGCVGAFKLAMEDLIRFVPSSGARRVVVNMSFRSRVEEDIISLKQVCDETDNGRYMLCCAATFYQPTTGTGPYVTDFPARYASRFRHVVSVGSTGNMVNPDEVIAPRRDVEEPIDPNEVTVVAPGLEVYSTTLPAPYFGTDSGSSMSTPIVAGVVSLMWSVAPFLPPAWVRNLLRITSKKLVSGERRYYRVDARRAVMAAWWFGFPWW